MISDSHEMKFNPNWAESQNRVGWYSEVWRDFEVRSLSLVYLKIMFMLTMSPSTYYLVFFLEI